MNANELADELMKCSIPRLFYLDELINNAAIMLRQQQAEIEALNQRIERMIENASHHEGIAHAGGFETGWQAAKAKTLTDKEIGQFKGEWYRNEYASFYDLVRAILRKANEK